MTAWRTIGTDSESMSGVAPICPDQDDPTKRGGEVWFFKEGAICGRCKAGEEPEWCPTCGENWTWRFKENEREAAMQACAPLCQDDWHVDNHLKEQS